jgi:cell division protein FtsB
MSYYKRQKNSFWKKIFCSQLFWTIILLGILIVVIIPIYNVWQKQAEITGEIEKFKLEKEKYEVDSKEWSEMITYLQSENSLEDRARTNLNLKKDGEVVVVIKKEDDANFLNNYNKNNKEEKVSNLKKWLRYFIK